ncbi:MAG: SpvB/TcaC N-terminal domain-containing protein [Candidatus Omnitrophota bacterium]
MKRIFSFWFLLTIILSGVSYADVTEDSFPAWALPVGSVGVENFQHDKFSGAAAYTIPLDVPAGTNGVQPSVALRYFSGGGNSSVGAGWNIDLGKITRSTRLGAPKFNDNDIFILQLNDTVSELVSIGSGQFRTKMESFLRINKTGSTWIVTDNSGTNYEYNYNVSNLNYYLTKITDTHNNYVDITYFSSD